MIIKFVFSTHVEVILYCLIWPSTSFRILHTCGGDPGIIANADANREYSPHMWRWSLLLIYPAIMALCILHTCGGDPSRNDTAHIRSLYSPHMWRWSYWTVRLCCYADVFSTHVEVILLAVSWWPWKVSILHTCGGDPLNFNTVLYGTPYSPHMWRWSSKKHWMGWFRWVFSTHVEVIPAFRAFIHGFISILHTCGGDPIENGIAEPRIRYSPHMWRWSLIPWTCWHRLLVFSTHVEVIP